jgi:hypothetical protein
VVGSIEQLDVNRVIHAQVIVANILFIAKEFVRKDKKIEAESTVPNKIGYFAFVWKPPILFFVYLEGIAFSIEKGI